MDSTQYEELISTAMLIKTTVDTAILVKGMIEESPTESLKPGMVVITVKDDESYEVFDISVDSDDEATVKSALKTFLIGYADAKVMVVCFVFGAMVILDTKMDNGIEKHTGFLARAITIDGRKAQAFLPVEVEEDGVMSIKEDTSIEAMQIQPGDYDNGLLDELRYTYMTRYNAAKKMTGIQRLH